MIVTANVDGHVTINLSRVAGQYLVRYWDHAESTPPTWVTLYEGDDFEAAKDVYFDWQELKLRSIS